MTDRVNRLLGTAGCDHNLAPSQRAASISVYMSADYSVRIKDSSTDVIFKNNSIYNASANTSHYIISIENAATNLISDNNNFYGPNGVSLGYWAQTTICTNLVHWQATSGRDAATLSADPLYISTSSSSPDLHVQLKTPCRAAGASISGITTDIDQRGRQTGAPTIGADEIQAGMRIRIK